MSATLKYYIRLDGSGRPVQGSVVKRQNTPKTGKWKMIPTGECCNGVTVVPGINPFNN